MYSYISESTYVLKILDIIHQLHLRVWDRIEATLTRLPFIYNMSRYCYIFITPGPVGFHLKLRNKIINQTGFRLNHPWQETQILVMFPLYTKEIETNTKLPKVWIDIKLHVIYLKPWNIQNTRMIITSCVAEVSQSLNTLLPHCAGAKVLKNGCLSRTCQDRSEPKGNLQSQLISSLSNAYFLHFQTFLVLVGGWTNPI